MFVFGFWPGQIRTLVSMATDSSHRLTMGKNINQRTNGPVNAHLSLLHIPINMFEYYGI